MNNNQNIIVKIKNVKNTNSTYNSILKDECNKLYADIQNILNKINEINDEKRIDEIKQSIDKIATKYGTIEEVISNANNMELNRIMSRINTSYRYLQNKYINKAFLIANQNIKKLEENTNEKSGNMIFSIASIFLGISLTSAIVAGVEKIPANYLLLYFLSGGLIILFTIGTSSILLRKFDKKSFIIVMILLIYCCLYGGIAFYTFSQEKREVTQNITEKDVNNQIIIENSMGS